MYAQLKHSINDPGADASLRGLIASRPGLALAILAALAGAAAGCSNKGPTGQVLAVVNGQDITSQDLESEARSAGAAGAKPTPELLQRVVSRVLLAQDAHAHKLDQYPGYPSDRLRMEQMNLAQRMAQTIVPPQAAAKFAPVDVERFMASHPYAFGRRERLKLDQIHYTSSIQLPESSMDSVFALTTRLTNMGIQFERTQQALDTAAVPPGFVEKVLSLPSGKPFFVRQGDVTIANVITGTEKIDVPQAEQVAMATRTMQQLRVNQVVDAELKRMREQSKITYQPGFAPKTPAKPGRPAASQP